LLEFFFDSFVILFVVIDPIGLVPMFVALTHGESAAFRRRMALRGVTTAGGVLIVFVLAGDWLLRALGIGMAAFQIAGGLLLFLLAVDMVLARPSGLRGPTAREQQEAARSRDISVFPLAVPLIAGPGALTTVLLRVGDRGGDPEAILAVIAVLVVVLAMTLGTLLLANRVMRWIGETGVNVVTRVLGIVLAALAVQYALDGLGQTGLLSLV
jgi:multiple antibiotic resistance protein